MSALNGLPSVFFVLISIVLKKTPMCFDEKLGFEEGISMLHRRGKYDLRCNALRLQTQNAFKMKRQQQP